jgi:hypothetical protein
LAKYTYGLLPLEQHHKIGKKKKEEKRTAGSRALIDFFFQKTVSLVNSKKRPKEPAVFTKENKTYRSR